MLVLGNFRRGSFLKCDTSFTKIGSILVSVTEEEHERRMDGQT